MSSEVRRISLKTVSNINNNNNNLEKSENNKKNKDNNKSKSDNKEPKTKRFVLELNTDKNQCNEFSFNDLTKGHTDKNGEQTNGLNASDDPFVDNDEHKLRQLEKQFQEKYGPKKRSQWEDYIDKGMGYDETDPFIDNEEAYDELVPSTLTTQYGGFYINCGELEFRPLSPDENDNEDDEDNIRPVLKRKRKLELQSQKGRRSSTELKKSRKSKIPSPNKTVAQMLQQKKQQQTNQNDNSNEIEEIEINDSNSSAAVVVSASVRDIVESVAKGEDQGNGEERNGSAGSSDAEDLNKKDYPIPDSVKLPDGLPPDLFSTLDKIKKLAHASNDGKRNFFNSDVNKMLLDIESKSRELPPSQRTQIYSHLALHLPCTKQTLMSRAKKVLFEAIEYGLQTAIANIATIVKRLQPDVTKKYQKSCEEIKLTFERNKQNGLVSNQTEPKYPRRVFPWNDSLKTLLNEAVNYKINLYDQMGAKNQSVSLKEYLYEFLDKEVKPIWPKGWMSLEILKHKAEWVKGILPPEQQSSQQSSQSGSQSVAHSSHSSTPNQSSSQIVHVDKINKVQTQQQSFEKPAKVQSFIADKPNKVALTNDEIEAIELKLPSNTTIKSLSSTYHKMNDQMSEGLVGKFMPAVKETKDNVNNCDVINLSTVDLSTKARSSPKPLNTPNVRLSPINLKTSPNVTVIKSNTPSPSVSPLAMSSILQSSKHEKLSREACLQKVIEQSLGDYPNSSVVSSTSSQRSSKTTSLPQTSLPIAEMLSKSFNSTPNKDSKSEVCIEIASSPEPFKKVQQLHQQQAQHQKSVQLQQKLVNKHLPSTSSTTPTSQMSFHRNSDMVKKKTMVQSSSSTQKELSKQDYRREIQNMDHLLLQSQIARNSNRDSSISIAPVSHSKSNENSSNSSKHQSKQSYQNSSSVITSTTNPMNFSANHQQLLNLHMLSNLNSQWYNNPQIHRYFSSQTGLPFSSTSSPANHSLLYPFSPTTTTTTTSHQTPEGRGRTSN